jgi:hypothetical protein
MLLVGCVGKPRQFMIFCRFEADENSKMILRFGNKAIRCGTSKIAKAHITEIGVTWAFVKFYQHND